MANSTVKRGSVVLIRYPFTDLTSAKVRPAVVLTPDWLIPRVNDVVCLFISSVVPNDLLPSDLVLEQQDASFQRSGLKQRSVFRAHKLAALHRSLVLRVLGEIMGKTMKELEKRVQTALGLRNPQPPTH